MSGKTKKAYDIAMKKDFYPEDITQLLRVLEQATIAHYAGHYFQSAELLEKAILISNSLYTKSLSKSALSYIINDNNDNYYSQKFEQSQMRFYLTLNYFNLAHADFYILRKETKKGIQEEKILLSDRDRAEFLVKARASALEWDSYLNSFKDFLSGKPTFKNDLSQKILAAQIHQTLKVESEKKIAEYLLKDAEELLIRNYNLYQTYNSKFIKFKEKFETVHELPVDQVNKELTEATDHRRQLQALITQLKSPQEENVWITLHNGILAEKYLRKIDISYLNDANLIPISERKNDVSGVLTFDIPEIDLKETKYSLNLALTQNGKEILVPLAIINPLSVIAFESHQELKSKVSKKTMTRKATKLAMATALTAAGAATSTMNNDNAALGAGLMLLGGLGYLYTLNSEKADLRYWSTLPDDVRVAKAKLSPGIYEIKVQVLQGNRKMGEIPLGTQEIRPGRFEVLNLKI